MEKERTASGSIKPSAQNRERGPSARRAAFTTGRLEQLTEEGQLSRDNLLAAAATAFMQKGRAATSIDDVARRLGATKGLVYHHYRSKNDLFLDVCRRGLEIDMAAIAPHAASRERAVTRLARMAVAHVSAIMERREFQLVILDAVSLRPGTGVSDDDGKSLAALVADRERYETSFLDALTAAVAEGDLECAIASSLATRALLSVLSVPLFCEPPREDRTPAESKAFARDLAAFALRGAGASRETIEEEFG